MSDEFHRRKFANYYAYKWIWTLIAVIALLGSITAMTAEFIAQNL